VINATSRPRAGFTKDPDLQVPNNDMAEATPPGVRAERADFVDASDLATALMGDSIATNLFMMGYAWQKGLIPLGESAIVQATRAQRRRVESNKRASSGAPRAVDLPAVERAATPPEARPRASACRSRSRR
jgi:indolepyruvate ferredoxin oxidoreductase